MKKRLIALFLLFTLLIVLSSCKTFNEKNLDTDNITETSNVFNGDINDRRFTRFRQSDGCSYSQFVETPEGIYYLKDFYVYFSSDGISKYVKLCSKPDCLHNDSDCNAYAGANLISYYDGYIYYVAIDKFNHYLFRMNMDGTGHVNIKPISTTNERYTGFFEHGYLYYYKGTIFGLAGNTNTVIYKTPVFDNSEGIAVVDTEDNDIGIGKIFLFYPLDEYMYFYTYSPDSECSVCRYSMETGQWSEFVNTEMCYQSVLLDMDKVYRYLNGEGFYEYTYETGVTEKVAESIGDGLYGISYNDKYIYAYQYFKEKYSSVFPMFYIFDRQYNLIDSVLFDVEREDYFPPFYVTELEDYVILSSKINSNPPDYYLLKSEFGSGDIKVRKIGD